MHLVLRCRDAGCEAFAFQVASLGRGSLVDVAIPGGYMLVLTGYTWSTPPVVSSKPPRTKW